MYNEHIPASILIFHKFLNIFESNLENNTDAVIVSDHIYKPNKKVS